MVLIDAGCAASAILQINPIEGALGLADAMREAELICDPSGQDRQARSLAKAAVAIVAREFEAWHRARFAGPANRKRGKP
jgi:hypothetical protein